MSSSSVCRPCKSNILALHHHTQCTEDGTETIQPRTYKMTQLLTQIISHPVLWHLIKPISSGCTLSLHKHRDKPLMSLHLRLRPMHVGSESKNKRSESDASDSGSDHSQLDFFRTSPIVVSELSGTWRETELERNGLGVVIRFEIESALARIQRSARKHISALYITHHCILSLIPPSLCHYLFQ